jgi:hypothetical protein
MLLRELKETGFYIFTANVKIRRQFYSQWIPIQVSARNVVEAKRIIRAQYGDDAVVSGLRKSK